MSPLEAALVELARRLDALGVAYMVIGGYANLQWGRPRLTEDLDVTVRAGEDALPALLDGLAPAFRPRVPDAVAFARETAVVPMVSLEGTPIDLVLARLSFEDEAIARAVPLDVGGAVVRFATAEDLVLHKIVSDRPRDREDLEGIVIRQKHRLDLAYLRPRVSELARALQSPSMVEDLERMLREAP
jgi:hypothetical protein